MYSKFWPRGGLPGILHHYTETLVAFEHTSHVRQPNSILFVGGLGDGLATTSYVADLVKLLPQDYSLFTLNLTSSYNSWGLGHLDRDTNEITQCLNYIKAYKTEKYGPNNKIVLMGHSTGSQCVLHYLYRPNPFTATHAFDSDLEHLERMPLDGAIMQAPVSDREAIQWVLHWGFGGKTPEQVRAVYEKAEAMAREAVRDKDPKFDTILPLEVTANICYGANVPISARRFLSLVSPDSPGSPQEDDLFSSDLSDEHLKTTFGMIKDRGLLKSKLMVLFSGADQAVPDWIDKEKLLKRWANATDHNGQVQLWDYTFSGIIPNASHALSNDDQGPPRQWLAERVRGYLEQLEKQS
ncbi:putative siderophore biosynthesis lipase/esterase [Aspergillus homomorphus CBS 101889]|uniref:Putative siderophore biosynthesis lipase/esterase n=1 Tax=Aspergillus homomorphus (strain CBS 101889) TaxID=1450537 RepID=A0A395ICC3_ASPHC|nr:putative siderophore biosynthesis lipase/esterase [Aspergillus homomorphus CBS 101889]RAL15824.1 putative siderophore biosynthesis lipase/esterase [Aspergillus homomorphus CBS 101889]